MDCEEKGCSNRDPKFYQCTGQCGEAHGHNMFNSKQLQNYKSDSKRPLICVNCEKEDADTEKRLEKLLKRSKRAGCTCKRPLNHKQDCPMSPRYLGEIPFPGIDVGLSRDDHEWLVARRKRKARK